MVTEMRIKGSQFLFKVSILVSILLNLIFTPCWATWVPETVDNAEDVGGYSAIGIDSSNGIHIIYYDHWNSTLWHKTKSSGTWSNKEQVASITIGTLGYIVSSMFIDTNNKIHICYYDGGKLKYATNKSGIWLSETVVSRDVASYNRNSIALDSNGKVYISFYDASNKQVFYASNVSGLWAEQVIDDVGEGGADTSLDIDSSNKLHLVYASILVGVKYATNTSGTLQKYTIDSTSGAMFRSVSMALDSNNNVHIVYYSEQYYELKYVTNMNGTWNNKEIIESTDDVGWSCVIGIDSQKKAHIAYEDIPNRNLKYATNATGSWVKDIVDEVGDVGRNPSLVVDLNNNVHVSYYDYTNKNLKYATKTSGSGGNNLPIVRNISVSGNTGRIKITYDLIDIDNDSCNITFEYQGGSVGTTWTRATTPNATIVSPGTGLIINWESGTDEAGQAASDYRIKITPNDRKETGFYGISDYFSAENPLLPSLKNPGFENGFGTNGVANDWSLFSASSGVSLGSGSLNAEARSGNYSQKIYYGYPYSGSGWAAVIYQRVSGVTNGATYTFGIWALADDMSGVVEAGIDPDGSSFNISDCTWGNAVSFPHTRADWNGWRRTAVKAKAQNTTINVVVRIRGDKPLLNPANFYLDDANLRTFVNAPPPVIIVPGIVGSWTDYFLGAYPPYPNYKDLEFSEAFNFIPYKTIWDIFVENDEYEPGISLIKGCYDWRQSIDYCAENYLKPAIEDALAGRTADTKVSIVAHSMGGLVTRWLLENPDDKSELNEVRTKVDKFVLLGTPNGGSSDAYYLWGGWGSYAYIPMSGSLRGQFATSILNHFCHILIDTTHLIYKSMGGNLNIMDFKYEYFKGLGDLMPTYDFLYVDGILKSHNTLNEKNQNPRLAILNEDANWDRLYEVIPWGTGRMKLYATKTLATIDQVPAEVYKEEYGDAWIDGRPIISVYQIPFVSSGDQTVLFDKSANIDRQFDWQYEIETTQHSDLPTACASKVYQFITGNVATSLPYSSRISQTEENNNSVYFISSDGTNILATSTDGKRLGYTANGELATEIDGTVLGSPGEGQVIIIPGADSSETYQVSVSSVGAITFNTMTIYRSEFISGSSAIHGIDEYRAEKTTSGIETLNFSVTIDPSSATVTQIQQGVDTLPPVSVNDLVATNPKETSLDLSWTTPGDDGTEGTASSYDIRYSTSAITETNWSSATQLIGEPAPQTSGDTQTWTITSLTPGKTYYFAMKTMDEKVNTSLISNVVSGTTMADTTKPSKPSNTSPSNGATNASLTPSLSGSAFNSSNPGSTHKASQWQISSSSGNYGNPIWDSGTDTTNKTSITVPSGKLNYSTTYYWHVRHQDSYDNWSDYSDETSFTTIPVEDTTPPSNPTNFTTSAGDSKITLGWTNPTADFSGVKLLRKTGGYPSGYNDTSATPLYTGTAQSYEDTGLTNGTTYYYKLYSYDGVPNYSSGASASAIPQSSGGGGDGGGSDGGGGGGGGGGCFIATAAYGTPMAEEVRTLCEFRDKHLLTNRIGKEFVGFYYKYGPYVADWIKDKECIKKVTRCILKPIVLMAKGK